jgi:hypothetical protein
MQYECADEKCAQETTTTDREREDAKKKNLFANAVVMSS